MTRLAERRKDLVATMMREEIYEAAVAVLTQHGSEGLTMDRVAAEAGVGKASLYKYFANKLEMLGFIHEKAIEPVVEAVQVHMKGDLPADRKLEAMLRTWLEHLEEHRALFNLFFNDFGVEGLLKSQTSAARHAAMQDIAVILREGIQSGVFRPVDTTRTTRLIFGAVRQLVEQQLAEDTEWSAEALTADVMDFFLRGLRVDR
jgi:TetR/AcrR family fatty acid metabolism transcriptional regulator